MNEDRIMTTKEIADYVRLNEKTVIRMAQSGKLPANKIGKQWRFRLSEVDIYLRNETALAPGRDVDSFIKTSDSIVSLSRLTDKSLMELRLKAEDADSALAELAGLACEMGVASSRGDLLRELKARESMLSTAIGNGVAIPHPRHPSSKLFKSSKVIIARSERGIDYDAPDKKPVRIFFMVCAQNEFIHLRLLSRISRLLYTPGVIGSFMKTKSKDEITRLLLRFDRARLFSKTED